MISQQIILEVYQPYRLSRSGSDCSPHRVCHMAASMYIVVPPWLQYNTWGLFPHSHKLGDMVPELPLLLWNGLLQTQVLRYNSPTEQICVCKRSSTEISNTRGWIWKRAMVNGISRSLDILQKVQQFFWKSCIGNSLEDACWKGCFEIPSWA